MAHNAVHVVNCESASVTSLPGFSCQTGSVDAFSRSLITLRIFNICISLFASWERTVYSFAINLNFHFICNE